MTATAPATSEARRARAKRTAWLLAVVAIAAYASLFLMASLK